MIQLKKTLFFILLPVFFVSTACEFFSKKNPDERGVYYWKSTFKLDKEDLKSLQGLGITRLYIKFFDVHWDKSLNSSAPIADVHFLTPLPSSVQYIPTVFITNEALLNTQEAQIPALAGHILHRLAHLVGRYRLAAFSEVQIDCDWTPRTQARYFQLLRSLKRIPGPSPFVLSATIRLHQVKYRKQTGVPPVDRGLLMFYNMTDVNEVTTRNSVLDIEAGKAYLQGPLDYPLPLDLALPLYSMGVVYQGDRFVGLINELTQDELIRHPDFALNRQGLFVATKNTYIRGANIYRNDQIRVEEVSAENLRQAVGLMASKSDPSKWNLVFFHFDQNLMRRIGHEKIQDIYRSAH